MESPSALVIQQLEARRTSSARSLSSSARSISAYRLFAVSGSTTWENADAINLSPRARMLSYDEAYDHDPAMAPYVDDNDQDSLSSGSQLSLEQNMLLTGLMDMPTLRYGIKTAWNRFKPSAQFGTVKTVKVKRPKQTKEQQESMQIRLSLLKKNPKFFQEFQQRIKASNVTGSPLLMQMVLNDYLAELRLVDLLPTIRQQGTVVSQRWQQFHKKQIIAASNVSTASTNHGILGALQMRRRLHKNRRAVQDAKHETYRESDKASSVGDESDIFDPDSLVALETSTAAAASRKGKGRNKAQVPTLLEDSVYRNLFQAVPSMDELSSDGSSSGHCSRQSGCTQS